MTAVLPSDAGESRRLKLIRTPDQRLRVFVSSTLQELAAERQAARGAIAGLHLAPVLFELGARPHPPRDLYRAYLAQSHIFVGIYWQRYGWVAPSMEISGLEDEYRLAGEKPKLIYIKQPAPEREPRLKALLDDIRSDESVSYKYFSTPDELRELVANDLALLLTERFEMAELDPQPEETAPAGSVPLPRSRLPRPATPLVSRDGEVAAVVALLTDADVRLVTLSGPGGIGKTRVALEVARELEGRFRDGVYFVELAPVRDPALVPATIAQALGIRETAGEPVFTALIESLRNRELLLVLDNFEHVASAAPLVGELLAGCPRLEVLATSREVLHLTGEHEFPIPPLELPDLAQIAGVEEGRAALASQNPAVQLFVQRAQATKPGFRLTDANALAVAEICVRLDGLPLAIELAAARSKLFTPQALLARLENRFELLKAGFQDLPDRHQTLRATIAWSYQLLDTGAQKLLRQLAVFAGGSTIEAISAVVDEAGDARGERGLDPGAWGRRAMYLSDRPSGTAEREALPSLLLLDRIESLLDKSLLHAVAGNDHEPRFRMLETIREYALEQLAALGEEEPVSERHLRYFLRFAEDAWPFLRGPEAAEWFARLGIELDNLRQALGWAITHRPVMALRLAIAIPEFWDTRGLHHEGRRWLDAALAAAQAVGEAEHCLPAMRAIARLEIGRLAFRQSDFQHSLALALEVAAWARQNGHSELLADALSLSGIVTAYQADFERALPALREGLALAREIDYRMVQLDILQSLAVAAAFQGKLDEAVVHLEESLVLARALGAARWVANSLVILSFVELSRGDLARAREMAVEGLKHYQVVFDTVLVIYPLIFLGQISLLEGDPLRAARLLGVVDALLEKSRTTIFPVIRASLDWLSGTARERMGEGAFDAGKAEGRAMTLERALAYAIEGAAPPQAA